VPQRKCAGEILRFAQNDSLRQSLRELTRIAREKRRRDSSLRIYLLNAARMARATRPDANNKSDDGSGVEMGTMDMVMNSKEFVA
jgi:hypothetical protein